MTERAIGGGKWKNLIARLRQNQLLTNQQRIQLRRIMDEGSEQGFIGSYGFEPKLNTILDVLTANLETAPQEQHALFNTVIQQLNQAETVNDVNAILAVQQVGNPILAAQAGEVAINTGFNLFGTGKPRKLIGNGFWEQQFINHVRREISDVNQTLFAQIQTDLKHRLAQQFKTFGGFIPFSNKQKLVDEAISTLKRLNNSLKEQTTTTNPLHSEQARQTAIELYESQGKVTGPIGNRPIIRENPPQFPELTRMKTLSPDVHTDNYKPIIDLFDHKNYFKSIHINSFDRKGFLQWGKFNTIYITVRDPQGNGHVGALIRRLTEPISYRFYDPHGKSWNEQTSLYYPHRTKLNSIVDGHNVDFNSFPHQCALPLCVMYTAARVTFPNLSNIEYDNIITNIITRLAEGEIPHIDGPGQPGLVLATYDINGQKTRRLYTVPNIEQERQIYEHFRNPLNKSFPLGNGLFLMKGDVVGHIIYAKTKQTLMGNPPNQRIGFGKRKCKKYSFT